MRRGVGEPGLQERALVSVLINASHGWIFVVLAAAAVAAVLWFYRTIPPSASRRLRVLLVVLRSAALVLLFAALVEPVLALSRTLVERPVVALLVDTSRSMAIADGTGGARRSDEAHTLLNGVVLPRVARDSELSAFGFDSDLAELEVERGLLTRPAPPDGAVTDLGLAFTELRRELSGRNLGAVVVASDGASNRGVDLYGPAMSLGVPVFVLGVGSPDAATDIAIEDAVTNRISYAGERVPIQVTLSSAGFEGADTVVELTEDGERLDVERVELSGTGEEVRVSFSVVPSEPGVHRYTVSVPPAQGELTTANNSRVVVTTAMQGRIKVLLAASRPSWDFAFLRREFETDRNVELTAMASKTGAANVSGSEGAPRSRAELFEYDLVVLVEPDWTAPVVPADWLAGFVRERGGGLLTVGAHVGQPPAGARAFLPFVTAEAALSGAREVRVRLTDEGETATPTRVTEDRFENAELWRELPPVSVPTGVAYEATADAAVLIEGYGAGGGATPVALTRTVGAGNAMSVLADGIWRWKMAGPSGTDLFGRLVSNAARWLTARGELERVIVTPDKDVFASGEDVGFSAQVYRGDFRLARDADVTVEVATGEGAAPLATVVLRSDGDFHRGETAPLAPGSYVLRATALLAGEEVGTAQGEFVVEEFSLEDSETRRRSALLRRVAEDSGGAYFTPGTMDALPEDVPLEWTERRVSREFELWNSPWLLLGFAGLMSVEWALRRKQGLP